MREGEFIDAALVGIIGAFVAIHLAFWAACAVMFAILFDGWRIADGGP